MQNQPSDLLRQGRRAIEELPFYRFLGGLEWYPSVRKWAWNCRITIEPVGFIPAQTEWYVVVDPEYPWGGIDLFPAKSGGITRTFQHQSFNGPGLSGVPWRGGKICVQTGLRLFGRRMYDSEPFTADDRLRWHISRAQEWLIAAGEGKLVGPGDPFELPDFHGYSEAHQCAFVENEESFGFWQTQACTYGTADVIHPRMNPNVFAIVAWNDSRGQLLRRSEYGTLISEEKGTRVAIWIRARRLPYVDPWQAPATLGELRSVLRSQGVDLDPIIKRLSRNLRDGKRHLLLVGFPIPRKIGEESTRLHWQGILLPPLSFGVVPGYRARELGYVAHDADFILKDNLSLDWMSSRNWHASEIGARGHLPARIRSKRILIIGAGALGSVLAELMVREGCQDLIVLDADRLQIGNICRHTLGIESLSRPKSSALAEHLNASAPCARVLAINGSFPVSDGEQMIEVNSCDIVVDCTGSDSVLHHLAVFPWNAHKLFVSVSVGMHARRLFIFAARAKCFPHQEFNEAIGPWVERELTENAPLVLEREGAGCWHPLFPARADNLWMMTPIALREIESYAELPELPGRLRVFEELSEDGAFQGVRRVPEA